MNDDLRCQYENYPYPPRDPADEAKRLIAGSPSHICEIEHHILSGVRNTSEPRRILVAGGGTVGGVLGARERRAAQHQHRETEGAVVPAFALDLRGRPRQQPLPCRLLPRLAQVMRAERPRSAKVRCQATR